MTTKKLITSDDPKGRQTTDLFRGAYNKAQLTEEQAQRLNENGGGEFTTELLQLIQKHSFTNQYVNEVVSSNSTYPKEYKGPKPIEEQVKTIAILFGLDPKEVLEFAKNLPTLPEGSEGWFAIPKVSAVATKQFPSITDKAEQYCEAVKLVHTKLADSRSFYNYHNGEIVPNKLRQCARTVDFLEHLESEQNGDILIIAIQYGMRHCGKSVRRARETFAGNEFGLGAFAIGCMTLVHPERYVRWKELDIDCSGDEFSPDADGAFSKAPVFYFDGGGLRFDTDDVSSVHDDFGAVSGFAPQK
ncbi:MAG: hypothetical protein U9R00_00530 [Patescibacteria group bacterium]|nr:hypothetical protein [Patescibacteria group bacterium]